jgi:tRNA uridine 5-carboxymethylaminomethyl modification enzyme
LLLRHDNADLRLTTLGYEIGLISEERYKKFEHKKSNVAMEIDRLKTTKIRPEPHVQQMLTDAGTVPLNNAVELISLLRRPEILYSHIETLSPSPFELNEEMKEQVEIQIKYEGYIEKQLIHVERLSKMEKKKLPEDLPYTDIHGLANEAKQRLSQIRPISIGQASRISGVTPADISILLVYMENYNKTAATRG